MDISALDISQGLAQLTYFVVYQLGLALAAPLIMRSDLYWMYLFSGLVIAWLTWKLFLVKTNSQGNFFSTYFKKDIWWHPSARTDYKFYLINALVMAFISGQFWLNDTLIVDLLKQLIPINSTAFQEPNDSHVGRLVFTVLFFIAYDFGRFVAHSLLHDVKWLWEFHKVHHSAEVLTPITASRVHPIDLVIMAWVPVFFTGTLTWFAQNWISKDITFFTFMGYHALIWFFNLVDQLRHWHVWVHYGPKLNPWLISPAHHQLHHSANPAHWGCNRGYELAIWDRLYGTFMSPSLVTHPIEVGLGDGTENQWRSAWALYFHPFKLFFSGTEKPTSDNSADPSHHAQ